MEKKGEAKEKAWEEEEKKKAEEDSLQNKEMI